MPFRAGRDGVWVRLKVTPKAKRNQFGGLLDEPDELVLWARAALAAAHRVAPKREPTRRR